MLLWLSIAGFGLLGVLARCGIDSLFSRMMISGPFPYSTLFINLSGSLLVGFIYGLTVTNPNLNSALTRGLMTGFGGGFTTFSSYTVMSVAMLETGRLLPGLIYFGISPVLGIAFAYLGLQLGFSFNSAG